MAEEEEIGRVMDYFAQISVAGIDLTRKLRVGTRSASRVTPRTLRRWWRACR